MADFMNYSVTKLSNATVTVPRWQISVQVVDSNNQANVIADLTGANAITFPNVLVSLTAAQRDEFFDLVTQWLILKKAGL